MNNTQELEHTILFFIGEIVEYIVTADCHGESLIELKTRFQINQHFAAIF